MTIKGTVEQEREQVVQLGVAYVVWYDKRVSLIKENPLMDKATKRTEMRKIFKRTQTKFNKDTNTVPKKRKKRILKKNMRTTYTTYEAFESAVRDTLPPLIKEQAMFDAPFYVFPLKIFYEGSVLPPEYFVETFEKKFGKPPANAIMYVGQGMQLLALGAVNRVEEF